MNDAQQPSPPTTEGPEPLHPDDDSSEIDLIGIFGLPQAPIFYPSEQEFQDPWKYLQSIRDKISKTGICVIQPPNQNWDFDTFRKCVNPKTFQFETKAQNVHQMQHRNGPNTDFLARLKRYWKNKKRPLNSLPIINGTIVDLYQLTNQVKACGGVDEVTKLDNWKVIAAELRVTSLNNVDHAAVKEVEKCYNDLLLPFAKYEAKKSPKKKKNTKTEEKMEEDGVEMVSRNTRPKRKAAINTTANSPYTSPYKASNKRSRSKSPSPKKKGKQTKKRKMNDSADEPLWKQVKSRSFTKETCDNSSSEEAMSEDSEEEGGTDFGYQNGQSFTLEKFQKMADEFETKWEHCKTPLDKEREYWRVVQSAEHWVQVQYGSDLDVANHSTGFPLNKDSKDVSVRQRARAFEKDRKKWKLPETTPYMSKTGWNTNNLSGATFLHHIDESVGGLTRPMLYVGMLFSSFCWHVEDNYLYSINYLHTGKPKLWYGVPGSAAQHFEETFRKVFPDLFKKNPNLLHLLITQLPPKFLKDAGVPVCTTLQNQGQFVVTCPRSFHGGFNTGFNCAESVNFALEDWLPFCEQACQDYRFQRSSVFPYEEFILKASQNPDNPLIQEMLLSELKRIIANEDQARKRISSLGIESVVINTTKTPPKSRNKNKTGYQSCTECGFDCYLSSVICSKHPDRLVCLNDVERLCSCSNSHKSLQIRKTMDELNRFATNLESSVPSGS